MSLCGDIFQIVAPHRVHPVQIGFLRVGRGIVANVWLRIGFVLADPKQVHIDAKPVQRILEIRAIRSEAGQQHAFERIRMQQDRVCVCGEVVLSLSHAVGHGHDLLAALLEAVQRRTDFAQGRNAGAFNFVRIEHDARNVFVAGCRINGTHNIAQLHLLEFVAERAGKRALNSIVAVLLDDVALRVQHQCRAILEHRRAACATQR